jgi:uncharacterized membrane protein
VRRPPEEAIRAAIAVLALAGLGVATYLTVVRAQGHSPTCVIGGGCETVQKSEYSELAGVPVAWLGIAAYLSLLLAALLPGQPGRALGLFTGLVGVGFSAWLTYAELVIIDAVCAWCVTSAIIITLAFILTVARASLGGATPGGSARRSAQDPPPPATSPPASRG